MEGSPLNGVVQLLGREYYQTSFGEKYLVLAPLVIHPVSAILKRVLAKAARRATSILSVTGYSAAFLVAMHFFIHRVAPSDPAPPIYSVGPSELDFEYVKYSLQEHPWSSLVGYLGLTTAVAWHAAEGMGIIWNTWLRPTFGAGQTRKQRTIGAFAGVLSVATGLFFIWKEPLMVFSSHAARFNAALSQSVLFRF